jgi:outer membrane protein
MHSKIRSAIVAAFVFAASSVGAAAQDVKIGIVDIEQALAATDEGKSALEEIKRKQREARAQVEPMMEQRNALAEDLKSKKYVLDESVLFQKQVQLAELENKIKSKMEELEGQLKIEQGKVVAPLQNKMHDIIETIGKEQGFSLILARNNPYVMYSREALDITDLVVARFNKKG